jgi:hypothetical protein
MLDVILLAKILDSLNPRSAIVGDDLYECAPMPDKAA